MVQRVGDKEASLFLKYNNILDLILDSNSISIISFWRIASEMEIVLYFYFFFMIDNR